MTGAFTSRRGPGEGSVAGRGRIKQAECAAIRGRQAVPLRWVAHGCRMGVQAAPGRCARWHSRRLSTCGVRLQTRGGGSERRAAKRVRRPVMYNARLGPRTACVLGGSAWAQKYQEPLSQSWLRLLLLAAGSR